MRSFDLIFIICGTLVMLMVVYVSTTSMNHPSYEPSPNSNPAFPTFSEATVQSSADHEVKTIDIPFSKKGVPKEILELNFTITFRSGQSTLFRVIPDDCIEMLIINEQEIPLPPQEHCNWKTGFMADLNQQLHEGKNSVYVKILNLSGLTGLQFIPTLPAH